MKLTSWMTLALVAANLGLALPTEAQQKGPPPPMQGGGPGGPGGGPMPPQEFCGPEAEQEALNFLEAHRPSVLANLKNLKNARPDQYMRMIADISRQAKQLKELQKMDPQRYESQIRQLALDEKVDGLAKSYQSAKEEGGKGEEIKQRLEVVVREQFDLREQMKEAEVKRMETELNRLKEKLEKRKASKDEIVKQRVNQLLSVRDGLEWE